MSRLTTFYVVLAGQSLSMLGSQMTWFALGVWIFETTGSATQFALLSFFGAVPQLLLLPITGTLIDRWDRRRALIGGDTGAALCTLTLVGLWWTGNLELPYIYLLTALTSFFGSFQLAFSASIPLLVPKAHLGRANGLVGLGTALAMTSAPISAGALLSVLGLQGVMLLDVATFVFAVATLLVVKIPQPTGDAEEATGEGRKTGKGSWRAFLREATHGWTFIRERKGLVALLVLFACTNLVLGVIQLLVTPLVLSFASPAQLGWVLSIATVGMVISGLGTSLWGVPALKIRTIFICLGVQGVILYFGGVRPSVALIAMCAFVYLACQPIIWACSQTVWQLKVDLPIQGRVFAVRQMIAGSTLPLASLLTGPLADFCETLLLEDGLLAGTVGRWIGVGPGRGIGFLFVCGGTLVLLLLIVASSYRPLRRLEHEIPDAIPDEKPDAPSDEETQGDSTPSPR